MSAGRAPSDVTVAFSLGSNLGVREENLLAALSKLSRTAGITLEAASSLYETAPVGVSTERSFINAACIARTAIPPEDLLVLCKGIERQFGRGFDSASVDRTLDIDIIAYGDACIERMELTIPHPRFRQRLFVLMPLAEICPNLKVPPSGDPVGELFQRCIRDAWVRRVSARGNTLNVLKTKTLE